MTSQHASTCGDDCPDHPGTRCSHPRADGGPHTTHRQCEGCPFPTAALEEAYLAGRLTVIWELCPRHERECAILQAGSNGALVANDGYHYF